MDRQEHIHIIGAGEQIEAACAAAMNEKFTRMEQTLDNIERILEKVEE
ncbi:hypothetical protein [Methanoregula sp. UBA64]|jgi:hypothetical protein|nr:hypothetical protein [Methanoregula sp. UBA64]